MQEIYCVMYGSAATQGSFGYTEVYFTTKGYSTAEWSECSGPVWNLSILCSRKNIKSVIEDLSKVKKIE